jgi:hypothetical protein
MMRRCIFSGLPQAFSDISGAVAIQAEQAAQEWMKRRRENTWEA